eukprot:2719596-Rhodomonas_salina.1
MRRYERNQPFGKPRAKQERPLGALWHNNSVTTGRCLGVGALRRSVASRAEFLVGAERRGGGGARRRRRGGGEGRGGARRRGGGGEVSFEGTVHLPHSERGVARAGSAAQREQKEGGTEARSRKEGAEREGETGKGLEKPEREEGGGRREERGSEKKDLQTKGQRIRVWGPRVWE